jgi:ABC-type nitrate/sulfonate/bicarbonate transport system substrate-binding protein
MNQATDTSLTRRQVLQALFWGGAAALMPWKPGKALAGGDRVRFGLRRYSYSAWPVEYAVKAGFFREAGVEPELAYFPDEFSAARALADQKVDLAFLPVPLFYALHYGAGPFAGKPFPLVTCQAAPVNGATLVLPHDSTITFSRQFSGKAIGATTDYGMPYILMGIYMALGGLAPGDNVSWTIRPYPELRRLLKEGKIAALAMEEWFPAEMIGAGEAKMMMPLRKIWNDYPSEYLAMARRFHESRSLLVEKASLATLRGARALDTDGVSELRFLYPEGKGTPAPWDEGLRLGETRFHPFPYLSAARVTLEEMRKRKQTPANADFQKASEETCLVSLSRRLMKEAGFKDVPAEDSRNEMMIGCCYTFF